MDRIRKVIMIIEGQGQHSAKEWQNALDMVIHANPGTRIRMHNKRHHAYWRSDGNATSLRIVKNCTWDGQSSKGSEFIHSTELDVYRQCSELIITESTDGNSRVIIQALHAAMDGRGTMHFLQELFRALRGETLLGTNAGFSDTELMQTIGANSSTSRYRKTTSLTGTPYGTEPGDVWKRITISDPVKPVLARLALATRQFHRQFSDYPSLIAVPVDLRRHVTGLHSTMNFTNMLLVPMRDTDDADSFKTSLQQMLKENMDTYFPSAINWLKHLPAGVFDCLASRTRWNYANKKPLETVVISNPGRYESNTLSSDKFQATGLFGIPLEGSAYCLLFGLDRQVTLTVGMPRVLANQGRMDKLIAFLQQQLTAS